MIALTALLLGCDGRPIDAVLPGGELAAAALPDPEPALAEGQGVGGSGTAGTGEALEEEDAAAQAISAQQLVWTRNLLGSARPVGH